MLLKIGIIFYMDKYVEMSNIMDENLKDLNKIKDVFKGVTTLFVVTAFERKYFNEKCKLNISLKSNFYHLGHVQKNGKDYPICIQVDVVPEFNLALIEPVSMVIDHEMIESWLKAHTGIEYTGKFPLYDMDDI